MGNLVIKNDSFIQAMHNDIQCLSLDNAARPCDRCWFTSKQIQDWAGMNKDTLNRKLEKLVRVGRIVGLQDTTNNIIDIDISNIANDVISTKVNKIGSGANLSQTPAADIQIASIKDSCGVPHEMKIYNLNVLNHLAMVELDNEKLDQANIDNDILKAQLELAKSSMFTNRRVCEILRDKFEISYADSTLKSRTSKALQSIANEFGENIIYDKQFVDGVLRKVPYYTQRTADILMQRLEYDCAYLRQF